MRSFLSAAILLGLAAACSPVSVSHYGTAKALGAGNYRLGGGFMVPRDGGSGFNRDQTPGDGVTTHHAVSLLVDNFDAWAALGVTPTTDVSLKVWIFGGTLGVKQALLDTNPLKIAIGGYFTEWASDDSTKENGVVTRHRSGQGTVLELPLTVSIHPTEHFAIYGGPSISRWDTRLHHYSKVSSGIDVYSVKGTRFYEGGFAGLCFGDEIQFNIGTTFMRESRTYPEKDFGGDAWFAYPYVNLTARFGSTKARNAPGENPPPPPQ